MEGLVGEIQDEYDEEEPWIVQLELIRLEIEKMNGMRIERIKIKKLEDEPN